MFTIDLYLTLSAKKYLVSANCCLQYMTSSLIFSLLHYFLTSFPHILLSFTHPYPSFCHFITPSIFPLSLACQPIHSPLPNLIPHHFSFLTPSPPHSLTPSSLTPSLPHPFTPSLPHPLTPRSSFPRKASLKAIQASACSASLRNIWISRFCSNSSFLCSQISFSS